MGSSRQSCAAQRAGRGAAAPMGGRGAPAGRGCSCRWWWSRQTRRRWPPGRAARGRRSAPPRCRRWTARRRARPAPPGTAAPATPLHRERARRGRPLLRYPVVKRTAAARLTRERRTRHRAYGRTGGAQWFADVRLGERTGARRWPRLSVQPGPLPPAAGAAAGPPGASAGCAGTASEAAGAGAAAGKAYGVCGEGAPPGVSCRGDYQRLQTRGWSRLVRVSRLQRGQPRCRRHSKTGLRFETRGEARTRQGGCVSTVRGAEIHIRRHATRT